MCCWSLVTHKVNEAHHYRVNLANHPNNFRSNEISASFKRRSEFFREFGLRQTANNFVLSDDHCSHGCTLDHSGQKYRWSMFHTRNVSSMQVSCAAQINRILSSSRRRHALQVCLPATLHVDTGTSWDEFEIARRQRLLIFADAQRSM